MKSENKDLVLLQINDSQARICRQRAEFQRIQKLVLAYEMCTKIYPCCLLRKARAEGRWEKA